VKFNFIHLIRFRVDNVGVFQRVSMNLNITVGQAACRLLCRYTQSLHFDTFPAGQVRFQQLRVIERFCVEAERSAVIMRRSNNDLEFFIDRAFKASISSFSDFRKLINAFHFFPRNNGTMGEGPHKWISLGPRIS